MKVLFLTTDSSAVAGVGPCLADALEHIDRRRIQPFVVCPWEAPGAPTIMPRLQALDVPVFSRSLTQWLTAPGNRSLRHFWRSFAGLRANGWSLANLIEREQIELVYTNGLPCLDGAVAARLTGRPHIWHLHEAIKDNPDLKSYLPTRLVEIAVGKLSKLVIVNSHFLERELAGTANYAPLRVVHNGVAIAEPRGSGPDVGEAVRNELGLSAHALIALAVGTVAPRKGYATLLEAVARPKAAFPDLVLLIAGAEIPDHAQGLRALAAMRGIDDRVRFLGPRQDIPRLLSAADIFVHSARQETFGRVIVEAMAAGKPVIATRSGGPEEIILDELTGFLVPVDSADEMARRLTQLLGSPHLRSQMGEAGCRRAHEEFSVTRYAESIQQAILDTAENNSSRSPRQEEPA